MNHHPLRRHLISMGAAAVLGWGAMAAERGQILDLSGGVLSGNPGTAGRRVTLSPSLAAIVGPVDAKGKGISGLQKRYDALLRDGAILRITIHATMQGIVEDELQTLVRTHQPKNAYAVLANPRNGAILAMAQYSAADSATARGSQAAAVPNRILAAGFEPGSIMKAITIVGALDARLVTLDTSFDCENGEWLYAGHHFRDIGHHYGVLPVRHIIQKSSNIGAAKVAVRMGKERLDQTLRAFGFGKPTGIDLDEEAPGRYRELKEWDKLSVPQYCMGVGIQATPLQMVQAYCALANGGVMPQLHLLFSVKDPNRGEVVENTSLLKGTVAGKKAVHDITEAMKRVTQEGGTGPRAALAGYEVAGMAGTAQKVVNGEYVNRYVASFIGYVPADDPAFVLLVVADDPSKGGYYGGVAAAPTFSRIVSRGLAALQHPLQIDW